MLLLKQFEEMTEEYGDPQTAGTVAKLTEIKSLLMQIFPSVHGEVLLNFFQCTYWPTETVSARGQLCICRNTLYFFGTRQSGDTENTPNNIEVQIAFKDVGSLELVSAKRLLVPDSIQVGVKDKLHMFALHFNRKEVFRILTILCNAAMNRLIKGAENSISASSEMFSKNSSNVTGDLAINSTNKGGGLLMGRTREAFGMYAGDNDQAGELGAEIVEQDFTEQTPIDTSFPSARPEQTTTTKHPVAAPVAHQSSAIEASHIVVRYSHIKTALVNSILDLDNQTKNMEFRNLFRLSYHETVKIEENPCYYFHKPSSTSHTGNMYLSQNFFNFAAQGPSSQAAALNGPQNMSTSILFDNGQDPNLVFVIPYPHIVSIKKQPATALPLSGKLTSFSLSGYLVISTKNRCEFWLAFSTVKVRDRVSEMLLAQIRTIDWNFDDDVVIGGRNSQNADPVASNSTPSSPMRSSSIDMLFIPTITKDARKSNEASNNDKKLVVNKTGLKFLVHEQKKSPQPGPPVNEQQIKQGVEQWNAYFDVYGRDVCIVKDMKVIRELFLKTNGIPDKFRGDFWMLVSGAWYSKPESGYYEKLLTDNLNRPNPFAEEIEKDVHRSLPENPAYQCSLGLDALRRVLTAFSWRNPAIGYAQALNIISASLLLHLREDDAFWMLCMIVERFLPDHYTKTLVGSVVDQQVFKQLVRTHLPKLDAHLEKLYMDLSTFSVPWFLCLYLNSVAMHVAVNLLDYFFLEGPKFLFWIAMAVLKVNEAQLIAKGKDDDIFVGILKDFFARLGRADCDSSVDPTDTSMITGRPLFEVLISTACNVLGPLVTTESIESMRTRYRLKVVHQMEDTNRKSQVRTLCEQVMLVFDEVAAVYDEVRCLEFIHGEEEEDPSGIAAKLSEQARQEEETMRAILSHLGGWGLVRRYVRSKNGFVKDPNQKTISLYDFRKVFSVVSPWKLNKASSYLSTMDGTSSNGNKKGDTKLPILPDSLDAVIPTVSAEELQLALIDRIYFYCSFQYYFVNQQKVKQTEKAMHLATANNAAQQTSPEQLKFVVDLAAMVHVLDAVMKQPLHSRLRFLFDLHDLDGDGFLNKVELKAVMDSFLEMFEKSRDTSNRVTSDARNTQVKSEDEEKYLRAVSSFLSAALQMGKSKDASNLGPAIKKNISTTSLSSFASGMGNTTAKAAKAIEDGDLGGITTIAEDPVDSVARISVITSQHNSRPTKRKDDDSAFSLSFNEFLLAVLSQSIFVQYFERTWSVKKDSTGIIQVDWLNKAT